MFKFRNDTRFIEYLKSAEGQYSIKVEYKSVNKEEGEVQRKWIAIGYISKRYIKEENKYIYSATDTVGNPVFSEIKDLYVLKDQFRTSGKQLAENAQMVRLARTGKTNKVEKTANPQKEQRSSDLKNLRDKKDEKHKTKEVLKQDQKSKNEHTEKELDAKNTEKYKDTKQGDKETTSKEPIDEDIKPEAENTTQQEGDLVSDRMDELDDIREQDNDIEQDMELDM